MRIYSSESVGKILRDMRDGKRPSVIREAERQSALMEQWETLPGLRLKRIRPRFVIDDREGTLSILVTSALALTLLRKERGTIERHLRPLMERYRLTRLTLSLSDSE